VVIIKETLVGHVAHIGEMRNAYKISVRRPEGRDHLLKLGIDWRIILKLILEKWVVRWTEFRWFKVGSL
jgi:hypothetical protein